MKLKQVLVTEENLQLVKDVWQEIFPSETLYHGFDGVDCFTYSLDPDNIGHHRYYLYYNGTDVVGMSGMYDEPDEVDHESAWLGWFGVREAYRGIGYGKQIIECFEDEARRIGYKFCRVYTEDSPDNKAIQFYKKLGYTFEKYERMVPPDCSVEAVTVGGKSISELPYKQWNNRPFFFN